MVGRHLVGSDRAAPPPRRLIGVVALVVLGQLALVAGPPAAVAADDDAPARLNGSVPAAVARATRQPESRADEPLTVTVVLNRRDQAGFDRFLAGVSNPASPTFRHFLSQTDLTARFGPDQQAYGRVLAFLQQKGLRLTEGSANRLTLTATGTRPQVARAFGVDIGDYTLDGRSFYSNREDPVLPAGIARDVEAIIGLSSLDQPLRAQPNVIPTTAPDDPNLAFTCWLLENELAKKLIDQTSKATGFDVEVFLQYQCAADELNLVASYAGSLVAGASAAAAPAPARAAQPQSPAPPKKGAPTAALAAAGPAPLAGTGQKIGLLEFDNFKVSDVSDYLSVFGPSPAVLSRLGQVHVNGGAGAPGASEAEVLLDVDAVLSLAPGANVVVYDGPFTGGGTSFQTMFNAMINDGVTVISNSWSYCEDQTSLADVQSINQILANAAASGVSVLNATGDSGSTCLDGSPNTIGVPADVPNATAVGGTTARPGPGGTYGTERWWDGLADNPPTGQGGYGVSRFFPVPSYQQGRTTATGRSIPDVAATADPRTGFLICQADGGGCPSGLRFGGTSVAAPIWAAVAADLNQASGRNLGALNPLLYPLGNTTAFHSAASMSSDFAHVGLGSPNIDLLSLALRGAATGPVSASVSILKGLPTENIAADGTTTATLVAVLLDAAGNTVSGRNVGLTASGGSSRISPPSGPSTVNNGAVVFTVTDTSPETVTYTATDTTDGVVLARTQAVSFTSPPATAGGVVANPTTVTANNSAASVITVTLQNAQGRPATGKVVTLAANDPGTHSTVTGPNPPVTDINGQTTFSVTDAVEESVTYKAVDVTDGNLPLPQTATVTFTNAPAPSCFTGTPTAAPGYAFTDFATGFPQSGCVGPLGVVFDQAGRLNVISGGDFHQLYRFGPGGGAAQANRVGDIGAFDPIGIAVSKSGRLYASIGNGGLDFSSVVELDPTTGRITRTLASFGFFTCATGLATDPISGDLFHSQACFGAPIVRISHFEDAGPVVVTNYGPGEVDGIEFGPDGTLYAAQTGARPQAVLSIAGTNKPQPAAVTVLTNMIPGGIDGIAAVTPPAGQPTTKLVVNRNDGVITQVDFSRSPAVLTDIFTGGSRGDFATTGPDGCLYATQTDRIIRVTNADGSCSFAPTSPAPTLSLRPTSVVPNPAQGTSRTFTARLSNVASPGGTLVKFDVTGANPQTKFVTADSAGVASLTYTGVQAGTDTIVASTANGSPRLASNQAKVTWAPGRHPTFVTLNLSPTGGPSQNPATLVAVLDDLTAHPLAPIGGRTITFSLAGQTCSATTASSGRASCAVTPVVGPGSYPLTATFAGDEAFTAGRDARTFQLTGPRPRLAPTALAYTGDTNLFNGTSARLAAALTSNGSPLPSTTVSFSLGSGAAAQVCSATTDGAGTASCTIAAVAQPAGPATVVASFAGDSTYSPATTSAAVTVASSARTATSITSSLSPSALGEAVTFTAVVTSSTGTPGGTVQFKDRSTNLGLPEMLAGGSASITTTALAVGSHVISAVYSGAATFQSSTSPGLTQVVTATIPCDQTVTGRTDTRVLGPGRWCVVDAMLTGLTIQRGASVSIVNSQVIGPLASTGATLFRMCGSNIAKGLNVSASTGFVLLGDEGDDACPRNNVSGNATISNNTGGVDVANDRVTGNLTVNGNSGSGPAPGDNAVFVGANQVTGALACSGNVPAPGDEGQPNIVKGAKTGQCAGL